jgi:hypothetical protein
MPLLEEESWQWLFLLWLSLDERAIRYKVLPSFRDTLQSQQIFRLQAGEHIKGNVCVQAPKIWHILNHRKNECSHWILNVNKTYRSNIIEHVSIFFQVNKESLHK